VRHDDLSVLIWQKQSTGNGVSTFIHTHMLVNVFSGSARTERDADFSVAEVGQLTCVPSAFLMWTTGGRYGHVVVRIPLRHHRGM
jgi:hypothetical protein